MANKRVIGALAIIIAAMLWALDGAVIRPSLYRLDVKAVVLVEHLIAFAFMAAFLYLERNELKKIQRAEWLSFFWVALFGGAIGTMAITRAFFFHESASAVVVLQKLQPLFAITIAYILLRERPAKTFYPWAAVALAGSYLVTFGFSRPVFAGNNLLYASLFSILAAFSFGSATALGKKAISKVNFRVGTYIRFGLTVVAMLAIISLWSAFTGSNEFASILKFGNLDYLKLLLIAFTSGGLAIFIYYFGLKRVMASKATLYELAFPVTVIVLEFLIKGELFSIGQAIGAVLIVVSMMKITGVPNAKASNNRGH